MRKTFLSPEKTEGWRAACRVAGIYLLVMAVAVLAAHGFLSSFRAEYLEWTLLLVSAVLIAFLVHHTWIAVRAAAELERRQLQDELRRSREREQAIYSTTLDGVVEMDETGTISFWNAPSEKIFGWPAEEAAGRKLADTILPARYREAHKRGFQRFLVTGEGTMVSRHVETTALHRDGTEFPVELTVTPCRRADGTTFIAFVRDITKRKQAEEALRFSEARYRALYRDNPTMVFTLDADWKILSANATCAKQLGYRVEELEGRSGLEVFYPEDRAAVAEQLRNCLQSPGRVFRWQFRKVHKDGNLLWVEEIAQGVFDPKGQPNILVVCQDVTERRRAKKKIERLNADLMARAADLEDANRELEAFNYAVAHDLRKPLTTANGYCQILQEQCGGGLDPLCTNYLQEVYNATLRMNQLIDTLLEFAQMAGVALNRGKVDLSAMAQAVVDEVRIEEPERRVTVRIAPGLSVIGDANLLRVVLENLLGNAWKYTGKCTEAIIEFGLKESGGNRIYFVRDNGAGFDMANVKKLFVPFQRLPGTDQFRGHGIGLATVERIIRRHGGRIWAEGEPGQGATFYFTVAEGEVTPPGGV